MPHSDLPYTSRRFLAYLIDWYVGALCTGLPVAIISKKLYGTMANQYIVEYAHPWGLYAGGLAIVFALVYYVLVPLIIWPGQTLGKRICTLQIVTKDNNPATLKELFLRQVIGIMIIEGSLYSISALWHQMVTIVWNYNVVTPLMYVGFVLMGVSSFLVAFTQRHQAIHDYIGGTTVVVFPVSRSHPSDPISRKKEPCKIQTH